MDTRWKAQQANNVRRAAKSRKEVRRLEFMSEADVAREVRDLCTSDTNCPNLPYKMIPPGRRNFCK